MLYTLRGTIANVTPLTLDKTLSLEGASADAKAVGDAINEAERKVNDSLNAHEESYQNPHKVTAEQVGLGNVDNTSDMDKPVSTAQAEAIAEAKKSGLDALAIANEAKEVSDGAEMLAEEAKAIAHAAQLLADKCVTAEYVDAKHFTGTVTLPVSGWSGGSQDVTIVGILETDMPHWGCVYGTNKLAEKEAFALVDELATSDNKLTFRCFGDVPTVALTIQWEVNR